MNYSNKQRIRGFTIVEILVAMLILGFGLVGVSQMQGKVVKQNTLSKQRINAINIAEGKLEELRNIVTMTEYNNLTSANNPVYSINADTTNNYSSDYTVYTTVNEDSSKKFKTVSIRVQWPDMSNNGNPSQYTTFDISTVVSSRRLPISLDMASSTILPPSITSPDILRPLVCECNSSSAVSGSSMGGMMMKNDTPQQDKNFVKVGGMMRWSSSSSTQTINNTLCNTCCGSTVASVDKKLFGRDFLYAGNDSSLKQGLFQQSALIKPSLNNPIYANNDFRFQNTMGWSPSSSTTIAACAVNVTTSTVKYRCH